jgi:hypothetical protein
MRRHVLSRLMIGMASIVASLALAAAANAVVTDMNAAGHRALSTPTTPSTNASAALRARIQLVPQGLRQMLRSGIDLQVAANQPADGIATITIPRQSARKAHIASGAGPMVVIGRGTVASVNGLTNVSLRLPSATVRKLSELTRVFVTVRLTLIDAALDHVAVDAVGYY